MVTVFKDGMQIDLTVDEYNELFGSNTKKEKRGRPKKEKEDDDTWEVK